MAKSTKHDILDEILDGFVGSVQPVIDSSDEIGDLKYASALLRAILTIDPACGTASVLLERSENKQRGIAERNERERIAAEEKARQESLRKEQAALAAKKAKAMNLASWICFFGFMAVFVISVVVLAVNNSSHSLELEVRGDSTGLGVFVGLCIFAAVFFPILACFCVFVAKHPKIAWTIPFPVLTLGIVIFTIATYAPLEANFNPTKTILVQAISKSQEGLTTDSAISEITFRVVNEGKYDIYSFSGKMTFLYSPATYETYNVSFSGEYAISLSREVAFTIEEPRNDCPFYSASLKDLGIQLEIQKVTFKQFGKTYDLDSGIVEIKKAGSNQ